MSGAAHGHPGYIGEKDRVLARLKRIEGQARGLQRMVEDEQYCIDILTQVSAMTSALRAVALTLLDDHLAHCVREAATSGEDVEARLAEASAAVARLVRAEDGEALRRPHPPHGRGSERSQCLARHAARMRTLRS
jgi:DNA-binding FrmR family transcriptional regulator